MAPISVLSGVSYFGLVFILYAFRVGTKSYPQGCALVEPGGPWRVTFALGRLENLRFSYKSYPGRPGFYRFRALGFLQFSLEHSLVSGIV